MQVQLVMFKSDGGRRDFSLGKDRIIIGRTNEVGLRIPLSSVSRKHCEIAIEGESVVLRDLGSSNGTLHNSVRVKEAILAAGDKVEVGPVVFIVVIDGVPAEVEPVRSLLEQELVDTSVGVPAEIDEDDAASPSDAAADAPSPTSAQVMEPPPGPAEAPKVEEEIVAEIEEDEAPVAAAPVPPPAPAKPKAAPAAPKAPAKAASAPKAAKPAKPGADDSPTMVDLDHGVAALEQMGQDEHLAALNDAFSFLDEEKESRKDKKNKKK